MLFLKFSAVPTWRQGWKWFSVWFGGLDAVLGTMQTIAQAFYAESALAEYTHTTWFHLLTVVLAVLAVASRFIHQPVATVVVAPPEKPTDKGN